MGWRRSQLECGKSLPVGRQRELDPRQTCVQVRRGCAPPAIRHGERDAVLRTVHLRGDVYLKQQRSRIGAAFRRFPAGRSQFRARDSHAELGTAAQPLCRRLHAGRLENRPEIDAQPGTALRTLHAAGGCPRSRKPLQRPNRPVCVAGQERFLPRHRGWRPQQFWTAGGLCLAGDIQAGAARRLRPLLRRARSESAGHAVFRQSAQRPDDFAARSFSVSNGIAALHHQHAHQSASHGSVARLIHGRRSLCRHHPLRGLSRCARSHAPSVQLRRPVRTDAFRSARRVL